MTNTTNEIINISTTLETLMNQMKETMNVRDTKIEEICQSIKEMDTEIEKREIEISKKREKLESLKEKKETLVVELEKLKSIVSPFDKQTTVVSTPICVDAQISEPKESAPIMKAPVLVAKTPVSTTFTGKVLPAYEGKEDLRVKHSDGRMCFIKESEAMVGKEYMFDIIGEGSYGSTYKVKVLSEVLACGIVKDETIELPVVEVEGRGSSIENSNHICYTCGEEVKNTPFAKLLAGMKVSK